MGMRGPLHSWTCSASFLSFLRDYKVLFLRTVTRFMAFWDVALLRSTHESLQRSFPIFLIRSLFKLTSLGPFINLSSSVRCLICFQAAFVSETLWFKFFLSSFSPLLMIHCSKMVWKLWLLHSLQQERNDHRRY